MVDTGLPVMMARKGSNCVVRGVLPLWNTWYRLSLFHSAYVRDLDLGIAAPYIVGDLLTTLKNLLIMTKTELIVSKLTTYDSDDLLYYTKIGESKGEMSLFCIVAGKTPTESRSKAETLLELLVKEPM